MVEISKSSTVLEEVYTQKKMYKKLAVLKEFPIKEQTIPASFDISTTFCDCDIITEVLYDLGIPSIIILQVCSRKGKFHIELYDYSK